MLPHAHVASRPAEASGRADRCAGPFVRTMEARREEILALLDEIRSREPTLTEIARVIAQASDGRLDGERLHIVAASVAASFKAK